MARRGLHGFHHCRVRGQSLVVITLEDYFRKVSYIETPSTKVKDNATQLLSKVNILLAYAAKDGVECAEPINLKVNSGWRPRLYNETVVGAAPNSKHISGEAVDLADPDGELDDWCMKNQRILEDLGLWLEHPGSTKSWTHLQSIPPRSGNRVFFP